MKIVKAFFAIMLCIALALPTAASAGWVDDWMTNATVNDPSYYQGQSRGYLSAGGYSARWQNSSEYLVSATAPRVKFGCGGIDTFMGGISYLDTDYLVKQLQQILQNAPSVALDLALNVLCTQCAKSMKEFQSMMSRLNSLQLDSCKASQAIVAKGMSSFSDNPELGNIVSDWKTSSGVSSFYQKTTDDTKAAGGKTARADVDASKAGCSAEFKSIFFIPAGETETTILTNIGKRIGLPDATIQALAGYVGDVHISNGADPTEGGFKVSPMPFCEENKKINIATMIDGPVYLRNFTNATGACEADSTAGAKSNLQAYVFATLNSIATKMENATALSPDEFTFLNTSSGDAASYLKYAVESQQKSQVINQIAPLIAKDMTRAILNDLYIKGEAMLAKAQEVKNKQGNINASSPSDPACNPELFAGISEHINTIRDRIQMVRKELNDAYAADLHNLNAKLTNIRVFQDNRMQMERDIANRFGVTGAFSR